MLTRSTRASAPRHPQEASDPNRLPARRQACPRNCKRPESPAAALLVDLGFQPAAKALDGPNLPLSSSASHSPSSEGSLCCDARLQSKATSQLLIVNCCSNEAALEVALDLRPHECAQQESQLQSRRSDSYAAVVSSRAAMLHAGSEAFWPKVLLGLDCSLLGLLHIPPHRQESWEAVRVTYPAHGWPFLPILHHPYRLRRECKSPRHLAAQP
mmetsp:Transcript_72436/g.169756  ORF Transcript_72436/g.169756 Transcript_72436/m.169756 type:complete len:213 (+) Transcript_72436:773-1411(+)